VLFLLWALGLHAAHSAGRADQPALAGRQIEAVATALIVLVIGGNPAQVDALGDLEGSVVEQAAYVIEGLGKGPVVGALEQASVDPTIMPPTVVEKQRMEPRMVSMLYSMGKPAPWAR